MTINAIKKALDKFTAQNGRFESGHSYCITGYNEYDQSHACEIDVPANESNPEQFVIDSWEDFVSEHNSEYCFDDCATICGICEIVCLS